MIELYYSAWAVAWFAVSQDLGVSKLMRVLEEVYSKESIYLLPIYRENKKRFFSDVLYRINYLVDQEKLDQEFPSVEKDFQAVGIQFDRAEYLSEFPDIDLFFMLMRLRLHYIEGQDYIRMKLRTLLKHYGYMRRSDKIIAHIQKCMTFYQIQPYLRGGKPCGIRDIKLDDMITFRVT